MAQDKKTDAARGVVKQEKDSITFESWENTSDFLARQIVDDLCRAGLNAQQYQHIVERTLLNWPGSGRTWGR